jgi:hypothetical protein
MCDVAAKKVSLILCLLVLALPLVGACSKQSTVSNLFEPVEVVSVKGPIQPINPGGPAIEIVLKNVGNDPVYFLTATLTVGNSYTGSWPAPSVNLQFTFGITRSNLLLPGETTSATLTLIGGAIESGRSYTLYIELGFINELGQALPSNYVKQVQILEP